MFAFVCSLWDEISVQLPSLQHKNVKVGKKWCQNIGIFAKTNMSRITL